MDRKVSVEKEKDERPISMVETYYKRIVRVAEYYIFACFILIAVVLPFLVEKSWVDGYIKVIYFTAFPLLVILLLASLFKEPLLGLLKRLFEAGARANKTPRRN